MNYEIIDLSSNSKTLCSDLRPARCQNGKEKERSKSIYPSKKMPYHLCEMAIKKNRNKKRKNLYLSCGIIL